MKVLDNIPFRLNLEEVKRELHLNKKESSSINVQELIKEAESLIIARSIYRVSYIDKKGEDIVRINGVAFSSRVLRVNLEKVERVFPYIITIGKELEDNASQSGDLLKQFYLETLGDMALYSSMQHLEKHLKSQYGLDKLANMNPGSLKDWPITEQKLLFSLFQDMEGQIGVKLTKNMLMIPRKSISGIYFPTEVNFFSCQLCPRERCQARKAPYDKSLREKYRLDDE